MLGGGHIEFGDFILTSKLVEERKKERLDIVALDVVMTFHHIWKGIPR